MRFWSAAATPMATLLLNALVWGLSWWPLRQLHAMGLHPLWATALSYLLAAALIGLWRPGALRQLLNQPALWAILLVSGMTNAAFNWAVSLGEVVRVVLLFYLMPLWSLPLAWLLLGERITRGALVRALVAVGGAGLVLTGPAAPVASGTTVQLADGLAVLAGFCFALNTVLLRRGAALPSEGRSLAMFVGGGVVAGVAATCLSASPVAVMGVDWPSASAAWLLPMMGLALVFLVSNLCLQYGAARLSARVTAVIMPCEVVFAAISALWWDGAVLHPGLLLGAVLVLGAALAGVWSQRN